MDTGLIITKLSVNLCNNNVERICELYNLLGEKDKAKIKTDLKTMLADSYVRVQTISQVLQSIQ